MKKEINQSENQIITQQRFSENLFAIEMKKPKVKMNKPIYLGVSILDISKTLIYKFWYDYFKPKFHTLSSGEIRKYEYLTGEDI